MDTSVKSATMESKPAQPFRRLATAFLFVMLAVRLLVHDIQSHIGNT